MLIMGIIATTGAMQMGGQVTRIRAQAEGDRLVACLRWMREMAHSRAARYDSGYGVYFWNNAVTDTCLQYSPYSPGLRYRYPDDPSNAVTALSQLGLPQVPVTLGQHSPLAFQTLTTEELSNGLEIVFQSDQPGAATYRPRSLPAYPDQVANSDWRRDRVVFWPPGYQAPALAGAPWPAEYGTSLPQVGTVTYNRIYILSSSDTPNEYDPKLRKMPVRIHIHPGTGVVRFMTPYERRDNGTW